MKYHEISVAFTAKMGSAVSAGHGRWLSGDALGPWTATSCAATGGAGDCGRKSMGVAMEHGTSVTG